MSKVSNNSNYNKVSVKTDSIVEMIRELSKLGVFKEKRKPRAKKATGDIRQENDMGPGFTQPTQIRLAPDMQALTQDQIEDIQRKNDALISGLRSEVQKQRQEDLMGIGYGFRTFRSAQQPGAGVYDPFIQTTAIEDITDIKIPDTQEERFTGGINEGAPDVVEKRQTTTFAGEDELPFGVAFAEIQPEEKVGGGQPLKPDKRLRREIIQNRERTAQIYGAGWPPPTTADKIDTIREYYIGLSLSSNQDPNENILNNKVKMVNEIGKLLDVIIA